MDSLSESMNETGQSALKRSWHYRPMERILLSGAGAMSISGMLLQGHLVSGLAMSVVSLLTFWILARSRLSAAVLSGGVSAAVAWFLIAHVDQPGMISAGFWCHVVAAWLLAWACVEQLASIHTLSQLYRSVLGVIIPVLFGLWLLILWELLTRGLGVPQVLLPSPSLIGDRLA